MWLRLHLPVFCWLLSVVQAFMQPCNYFSAYARTNACYSQAVGLTTHGFRSSSVTSMSRIVCVNNPNEAEVLRLPTYVGVGRKLLEQGYYNGVIQSIVDCAKTENGFIILDSPSGSGKSQAGIALRELDHTRLNNLADNVKVENSNLRVLHLVWDRAVAGQIIYNDLELQQYGEGIYSKQFFNQARIFASAHTETRFSYSDRNLVCRDLLQSAFEKYPTQSFDVAQFREKHHLDGSILVLFIDEVPSDPAEVQILLTIREALKTLPDVVLVFAGTSAKVANAVSLTRGYSSAISKTGAAQPWSLLITRLPQFVLESSSIVEDQWNLVTQHMTTDQGADLKAIHGVLSCSIAQRGNPRLIIMAIGTFVEVLDMPVGTRFQAWRQKFSSEVSFSKFAVMDAWSDASSGMASQLNLLLEASTQSAMSDVMLANHFGYRSVPDDGKYLSTSIDVSLADCGGWLYIANYRNRIFGQRLQFKAGQVVNTDVTQLQGNHEWQTTVFAPFHRDPLLYISSCREGGYFTVVVLPSRSVSLFSEQLDAHEVVLPLWSKNAAGMINFQNPNALCNTGSLLEVLTTASICNAAAVDLRPLNICEYLGNLISQLGIPDIGRNLTASLVGDAVFSDITVPNCLFPGLDLPPELKMLYGFVGLVARQLNAEAFDILVSGLMGRITSFRVEAKDRDKLTTDQAVTAFNKLVKREGELGVLVVRGCSQYWSGRYKSNRKSLVDKLGTSLIGKIYFVSRNGELAELDLENGKTGRVLLIQVPPHVVGRQLDCDSDSEDEEEES